MVVRQNQNSDLAKKGLLRIESWSGKWQERCLKTCHLLPLLHLLVNDLAGHQGLLTGVSFSITSHSVFCALNASRTVRCFPAYCRRAFRTCLPLSRARAVPRSPR